MDKKSIRNILLEIEKENKLFSNKASLDILAFPPKIVGRKEQAGELLRLLYGYKKGHAVPFISVYGRSGSGKSTLVRFVCENLDNISYIFVNLRKAKTVFGCANQILAELGQPNLKSAQGLNAAFEKIVSSVEDILKKEKTKFFVMVLDEFDVLFYDTRGNPSDFVYKLAVLEEKLRELGLLMTIIAISNNVMSEYELDDRVRSRIGSSEVFFGAYSKDEVFQILKDRARLAFSKNVEKEVLQHCAKLSSAEHGDARRAIDLLRVSAEIASKTGKKISKSHVDLASDELQRDRINNIISGASYQLQVCCAALARISYLTGQPWHSTSTLYKQYKELLDKDTKPLTYRRISGLLAELKNSGLAVDQTSSKGRHGYGTQYKLTVSPELIGTTCFAQWWDGLVKRKNDHESQESSPWKSLARKQGGFSALTKQLEQTQKQRWNDFVGLD